MYNNIPFIGLPKIKIVGVPPPNILPKWVREAVQGLEVPIIELPQNACLGSTPFAPASPEEEKYAVPLGALLSALEEKNTIAAAWIRGNISSQVEINVRFPKKICVLL